MILTRSQAEVVGPQIFFCEVARSMILFELGAEDPGWSSQNLEAQGFTGKILRNKELGGTICLICSADAWWKDWRTT